MSTASKLPRTVALVALEVGKEALPAAIASLQPEGLHQAPTVRLPGTEAVRQGGLPARGPVSNATPHPQAAGANLREKAILM